MKIGIVGGGISGLTIAWRLAKNGYSVDLFEAGKVLSKTSSNSSKLLHGGIRYLESGHLGLVKESLKDRYWWLKNAPTLAKPIKMVLPVHKGSQRSLLTIFLGAKLYEKLAGKYSLGSSEILGRKKACLLCPDLDPQNLRGCVTFYDGQMNEGLLGHWMLENAKVCGVNIFENSPINTINTSGEILSSHFGSKMYNCIINAAGPWAKQLAINSSITGNYSVDFLRGSHILVDTNLSNPYVFQEPIGKRIVFVLPYLGNTLIGTTEVSQKLEAPIQCSSDEKKYLLRIYNNYFSRSINDKDIISSYAGLRLIVDNGKSNLSMASRESAIEVNGKIVSVYGGKWTTAPSLSKKVFRKVQAITS